MWYRDRAKSSLQSVAYALLLSTLLGTPVGLGVLTDAPRSPDLSFACDTGPGFEDTTPTACPSWGDSSDDDDVLCPLTHPIERASVLGHTLLNRLLPWVESAFTRDLLRPPRFV